jgi:FkbM family methyltransferase
MMRGFWIKLLEMIKKSPVGGKGLTKIFPFNVLYDFYVTVSGINKIPIEGGILYCDPRSAAFVIKDGGYDPVETPLVKNWIKPGDTIIDAGANIGYYSVLTSRLAGPAGKVFSFEPSAANMKYLKKNIAANSAFNVTAERAAIASKDGELKLYISPVNFGDHRVFDYKGAEKRRSEAVQAVNLDNYMKGRGKVDFVKMDIQGAESDAIKGMNGIITNNSDIKLMIEFWPTGFKNFGADPVKFLEYFRGQGFKFYDIFKCYKTNIWVENSIADYIKDYTPENDGATNIIFTRNEPDWM